MSRLVKNRRLARAQRRIMIKPESAWLSAVGEIEIGIGRASYATWLKSARFIKYEDGQFVIGVQNGYVKEWMETRLLSQLKRVLMKL